MVPSYQAVCMGCYSYLISSVEVNSSGLYISLGLELQQLSWLLCWVWEIHKYMY